MFSPFGFSIQEFFIYYFYCQKTAFVCEFQHTPLCKMTFFSRFHKSRGYEILLTCKVECPKTGHLRSCTWEYFEYQLWNILGCRKIRIEKDFYFFIIFCYKM
jgi:hypothetical protein